MKNTLKKIYIFISKFFMSMVYDKKYLKGKYFENNIKGWRWCWRNFFMQKIIGYNRHVPFPVSHRNNIGDYHKLKFHPDNINMFQNFGCYFQCYQADIIIGKGTHIAPNVGIITQNHNLYNPDLHSPASSVIIGENCWIGMNSVILPGVILGDHTVVGAGSVVTKSFEHGNCLIGGVPARIIKKL